MNNKKPTVMILGTFHMRYTPDLFRLEMNDILKPKRQQEIEDVVARLKRYHPTKVAFEIVTDKNDQLNGDYQKYLSGDFKLLVDEVHQFGFRLAADMNHKEVYAVDWMELIGNRALGQVYDWAKENEPERYASINSYRHHMNDTNKTIREMLIDRNSEKFRLRDHQLYLQIAQIGHRKDYVGIDWVRWWYQRNLVMYANIARLADNSNERILFIVGGAHVHLVSQFLRESGQFKVEEVNHYLEDYQEEK